MLRLKSSLGGLLMMFLASCAGLGSSAGAVAVHPALWEISGPGGEHGWLFGTIHALPEAVDWRSPRVRGAMAGSDRLVVEVGSLKDAAGTAAILAGLARNAGAPPLSQRVRPDLKPKLAALLAKAHLSEDQFTHLDTWAAAVMLTQIATGSGHDSANGVDLALLSDWDGKPVVELEGAETQLRLFDTLPEADQRFLLDSVVEDSGKPGESERLATAWERGDMKLLAAETREGMLADPELRQVLYVGRNRAWTDKLAAMLQSGAHPFVAVGAAHMAGSEGLPAMLAAKGFKVRRVQ